MPILGAEPDMFPDNLLDQQDIGSNSETAWWALYTLPRREKELMRRLRSMQVSFYGPLIQRRRRSPKGRVRTVHASLFPGYVFLYGDNESRYRAMTTNCVSRNIDVPDKAKLVCDLRQIYSLIEVGAPITPEARLAPQMQVRVKSGPFAGMLGIVIRRDNRDRLVIAVNFLKQGASVVLDDYQLERVN